MAKGFLTTEVCRLTRKAAGISFRGRTGLDGSLDYRIDLTEELQQHRDGRKLLDALGGRVPEVVLGGTLDEPVLQLPDTMQQIMQQGLQRATEELLQKGLDRLFRRRKK